MLIRSRAIEDALDRYRPGWTLEQFFYTNEDLFEYERRTWLARQWYLIGHASEVPQTGMLVKNPTVARTRHVAIADGRSAADEGNPETRAA